MFDTSASDIATYNQNYETVCYISVGSWEDLRPDANDVLISTEPQQRTT
eukprot:UN04376